MATVTHLQDPSDNYLQYLQAARKHHTQAEIARHLEVDARTVRRWEARQSHPPRYVVSALQKLLFPLFPETDGPADFTFIDLFAGIGGIRMGFETHGGRCVFTSEWDEQAQKTYVANFPETHEIAGDITKIEATEIPDHDVLLAGFPCQPFSIAGVSKKNALGRSHGFADETQGTLFFDVARIIAAKRPRAFLLENVKNLRSHDKGRTFDVILRTLREELGYNVRYRIVDGQHFVPQHRERILIAGFREPNGFDFDCLQLPDKSVQQLASILHPEDGSEKAEKHYTVGDKAKVSEKYFLSAHLWGYLQAYAEKHRLAGNGFGFGLVGKKNIARTLSARYYKDDSEILVSRGKNKNPRRLTPRECARLMGFPDTFKIPVSDTQAYKLFSQAAVVPVVVEVAKLMLPYIKPTKRSEITEVDFALPKGITSVNKWSKEQLKVAFNLYCQMPFGKMHHRNPEIVRIANLINRTPSALAMKLVNFASLDPAITGTGRKGLGNASAADREIWDEFHADWERLALESQSIIAALTSVAPGIFDALENDADESESYEGETKPAQIEVRLKQAFFRRTVLSSYQGRCCMTGISEPKLLLASHIVPWSKDKANRLNPRNGLCLSALHDRAYDKGLITVSGEFRILVSATLKARGEERFVRESLLALDGQQISLPEKFVPSRDFLERHVAEVFLG